MSTQEVSEPSDEEMRKLLLPNPSQEQALDALTKSYGEPGQEVKIVKELESYDDKNFWVKIGDTSYLAKFHNGVESKDFLKLSQEDPSAHEKSVIHLQNTIMEHLSQHGISTSKPQMPKTSVGGGGVMSIPVSIHEVPVVSSDHGPCKLVLRLLSWVEGRTMDSVKMLPLESLADAGRFLGRLTKSLSKLETKDLAAARRYHQWDTKNTADLKEFVQYIGNTKRRSMVESVIEAFQRDIIDSKAYQDFPVSLIHADFNDANILLDENCRVSGVIDFGDSLESWRVLDLSVAMAYAMLTTYGKNNRAISAAAAFLRGYSSVCDLTDQERKHLVLLIACRLSCSVTLGAYSYKQNPENEYLLLHAKPGWDTLGAMWGNDPVRRKEIKATLDRVFDQACSKNIDDNDQVIDCSDLAFPDPHIPDPFSDIRAVIVKNGVVDDSEQAIKRQRL